MSRCFKMTGVGCLIASLGACAAPIHSPCAPGAGTPMAIFTLYFGRTIHGRGDLTDKEWLSFLGDTVTPNLPKGYTILDANGAWMNPDTRTTEQEATKVLVAALPEAPDSLAAVNLVRSDYQARFHQQLVGMTVEQACGTF